MEWIINHPSIFKIVLGGRGIGKTYGALEYFIRNKAYFIFMRTTDTQMQSLSTPQLNIFNSINQSYNLNLQTFPLKKSAYFYAPAELDEGKIIQSGDDIGMGLALSTIANLRGFSAEKVTHICYDEFIAEKHVKKFYQQGDAFFNAYETINRNRELQGKPPVKVLLMSNDNDVESEILYSLKVVDVIRKMIYNNRDISYNPDRGLLIVNAYNSPISSQKENTALYKMISGGSFRKMALENRPYNDFSKIASMPIKEYKPLVVLNSDDFENPIVIYEHKSTGDYYISEHYMSASFVYNLDDDMGRMDFRRSWGRLINSYIRGGVKFETYHCEMVIKKYLLS